MSFLAYPLLAVLLVACEPACDLSGYTPMRVQLVAGSPAPAVYGAGCVVTTGISHDGNPDAHPDELRHIGESVYQCLTGTAQTGAATGTAFYDETLWFRIDGECRARGCFSLTCRTVDTNLAGIGAGCPPGPEGWSEACWTQFYKVIGHEVMHGWLGEFHA